MENIRKYIPCRDQLNALERVFSVLCDKTRIRIVCALAITPLCVGELGEILRINQTTLSHQLAILRSCGAVEDERRGKTVIYAVKNKAILSLFSSAVDFLEEDNAKNEGIAVDF